MFRDMRRKAQQLSADECEKILSECTSGVLAVSGDDGYPYAVPLSYVYNDSKLYFHCALSGHKLDAVRCCDKASFCVVEKDDVVPEEYTTYFRSVIAFGRIRLLDGDELRRALLLLARKYNPTDSEEHREAAIDRELSRTAVMELTAEHITGKEAIELKRAADSE